MARKNTADEGGELISFQHDLSLVVSFLAYFSILKFLLFKDQNYYLLVF
jgi:hypothetical protein